MEHEHNKDTQTETHAWVDANKASTKYNTVLDSAYHPQASHS